MCRWRRIAKDQTQSGAVCHFGSGVRDKLIKRMHTPGRFGRSPRVLTASGQRSEAGMFRHFVQNIGSLFGGMD